jgi:membrane-associated phospholipid phosphatase
MTPFSGPPLVGKRFAHSFVMTAFMIAAILGVNALAASDPVSIDASALQAQDPAPQIKALPAPQTEARDDADQKKPPTPPHTGVHALLTGLKDDVKHLPSAPNLFLAVVGGGLAVGVHPFDASVNGQLRSHYGAVNALYAPAKYYGDTPEQVGLALGTYAFGRIFDEPRVSHLGMDLVRGQVISELLVEPLKLATHRRRPDGSNHLSFPSGHASATFAAATIIERHLGWKRAALAYAIASYVATSRLHDNVHYLSDVVFGAAVGTIAGRTVTQHGRDVWTFQPVATPGGVMVLVVRTP